ncbi:MAG TPA: PAS domain-containing protein, partial [Anaeromyxobacteraceae bacterium]|nr:PAS domain-containing protein [Anaeromyxobacteraceae bacterium]
DDEQCSKQIADCPKYLEAYFEDGTPAPIDMWAMPRALRGEVGSNVEYMLRRKDTGEAWWGSYCFGPVKGVDGKIVGAVVAAREITEHKRAEEALRRAHDRLAFAQRSAGAGIWDWDMSTERLDWSHEMFRLFGLDPSRAEANFDTWRSILHREDRELAEERIRRAVESHTRLESEYRIVLASGEVKWISALSDTGYDADGRGRMAPDGTSMTLELHFRGMAVNDHCGDGPAELVIGSSDTGLGQVIHRVGLEPVFVSVPE